MAASVRHLGELEDTVIALDLRLESLCWGRESLGLVGPPAWPSSLSDPNTPEDPH